LVLNYIGRPYPLNEEDGSYLFKTDNSCTYRLYLEKPQAELFIGFESLENQFISISLIKTCLTKPLTLRDSRIKDTVCTFIMQLLEGDNNLVILFNIEDADNTVKKAKSTMRKMKFSAWYDYYKNNTINNDIDLNIFEIPSSNEFNSGFQLAGYIYKQSNKYLKLISEWETSILSVFNINKASPY
jgi:hypothetical protein